MAEVCCSFPGTTKPVVGFDAGIAVFEFGQKNDKELIPASGDGPETDGT